jgi:hypothetical protein
MAVDWISALEAGVPAATNTYLYTKQRQDQKASEKQKAIREAQLLQLAAATDKRNQALARLQNAQQEQRWNKEHGLAKGYYDIQRGYYDIALAKLADEFTKGKGGGTAKTEQKAVPLYYAQAIEKFLNNVNQYYDSGTYEQIVELVNQERFEDIDQLLQSEPLTREELMGQPDKARNEARSNLITLWRISTNAPVYGREEEPATFHTGSKAPPGTGSIFEDIGKRAVTGAQNAPPGVSVSNADEDVAAGTEIGKSVMYEKPEYRDFYLAQRLDSLRNLGVSEAKIRNIENAALAAMGR